MRWKRGALLIFAFLFAFGIACPVQAKGKAPEKISLSKKTLTLYVGDAKKITVKSVTPQNASKRVTWKSSDKKIAVVTASGVIKGIKPGKVTITAVSKENGKKARCEVTVKKKMEKEEISSTQESKENVFYIKTGGNTLSATFENNSSADAFRDLLKKGDVTVSMSDYGNFEKVGSLGSTLPRNDKQITTVPGDVILYQGNSITIYYDTNSWSFTRLGKIEGATKKSMKNFLGDGTISVVFSLNE